MTREEATELWEDTNTNSGCSCSLGYPPCSFCVDGFSLQLDEYLELYCDSEETSNIYENYDRAMGVI